MLSAVILSSTFGNVFHLLVLVVVFILILFATYYCTRFIGKYAYNQTKADNIEVVETFHLSQAKYIQIVRVGKERYVAIAVSKDTVEMLAELTKDELVITEGTGHVNDIKFADILKKIRKK